MFVKKLYQYNKQGCLVFVVFIAAFLFINYKWGITATPILQYGMYSSPVYIKDTQTTYVVIADNEIVDCSKLSFVNRDIVQLYPANYEKHKAINENVFGAFKKYKLGSINNDGVTDSIFTKWYRSKLETILDKPIHSLQVYRQSFLWTDGALQPIDSPYKLQSIVP